MGSIKKMKALGIGEIVFDIVNSVSAFPIEGVKIDSANTDYSLGGPVPSALILLSRLGVDCALIGSIGKDSFGEKIQQKLKKEKIALMPVWQKATKVHTVIVDSQTGSRTIIKNNIRREPIEKLPGRIVESADLIIIDRHEPLVLDEIVQRKKKSAKLIIDPSTEVSEKTLKMIRVADFPIVPIETLAKIGSHKDLPEQLKALYQVAGKTIIVTAGEKGCLTYDGSRIDFFPAYNIKAVDVLGAGDIFRGAFGYGVLNGWDMQRCACFANMVAALQCLKLGNGSAIPTRKEIEEFEKTGLLKNITFEELIINY